MGQAISSSSSGENNGSKTQCSTPIPAPPVNSYLMKMAERPPVHCCFYYENQCKEGQIRMPLLYQLLPDNKGTRLMDLELWLRDQFNIPKGSSVFAVIPATELYCTPYPLVMINTIVSRLYADFENERVPVLHFALVVRGMSLLKQPIPHADAQESPFFAISATALAQKCDSIERKFARMRFVQNMKTYGFARIVVTPEQAQIPQEAFKTVRVWLKDQLELSQNKRWRDWVDATRPPHNFASNSEENIEDSSKEMSNPPNNTHPLVSSGRYVGFNEDANREYLQLRLPIAKSGTLWPSNYFEDDKAKEFAMKMLELLCLLDGLGRNCMEAVCEILNLDPKWMFEELLDDPKTPPSTEEEIQSIDKTYQYGASVLRIYNYRNKGANGEKAHPYDPSCGVHADLGLVTVSPVATVPGLQMWNLERMIWVDVEEDADLLHFSVFAGETLGFITNGLIKAPLHRVPGIVVQTEDDRRMSMPYFLRVRPQAVLNPTAPTEAQLTCRDFMEDIVLKTRPWRRRDKKNPIPPDY